jgi:O-ureido-D-serine cyclo-ligase
MARTIALVTAREALALDEDLPPLVAALCERGAEVDTPCWDDPDIDWSRYDVAVIRSTWDYADRVDEFLGWTERVDTLTRLFNPAAILRWSTDKHYLRDLARAGVPVVPTRFAEPGEVPEYALASFLGGGTGALSVGRAGGFDEFVIKPAIGAGSRDAARYRRDEAPRAAAHLGRLLEAGRSALLQPYLRRVDDVGETALVYLDGRFSHAICKAALLRPGAEFVSGLFAPETISARQPGADEMAVAAAACAAIATDPPLYARIDLIRDGDGRPVVLELELAEPSLFFTFAPGSAGRFARAILDRTVAAGSSRS